RFKPKMRARDITMVGGALYLFLLLGPPACGGVGFGMQQTGAVSESRVDRSHDTPVPMLPGAHSVGCAPGVFVSAPSAGPFTQIFKTRQAVQSSPRDLK